MARPSAFLEPGPLTTPNSLAIVQLSRDDLVPLVLKESSGAVDGYAEGAVLNTRFGSFPHSTLIGVPWGSQVRASAVDTGSRGRKRKRLDNDTDASNGSTPAAGAVAADADADADADGIDELTPTPAKKAVAASSGFIHILKPTPELWTQSLPHRTQVVYTPDYSYILQRLHARPGMRIIEAGAGSGSFTHAAVRAIYSGYPQADDSSTGLRRGKVFSFEFNESRYDKMHEEIQNHHLEGLVQLTHRDAYNGGFLVDGESPEAEAVFLDLPAPWEALPHLSRTRPSGPEYDEKFSAASSDAWISPLHPRKTAYLCTFSPCIEQVQRTVTTMRRLGWIDIDMVEIAHRRINVIREKAAASTAATGKKAPPEPKDVSEAVSRLRDIERRARLHNAKQFGLPLAEADVAAIAAMDVDNNEGQDGQTSDANGKPWMQGRVVHRTEGELKSHTSYLVFATLPREWSEEDEAAALAKWPCGKETKVVGNVDKATRKKEKRELLASKKQKKNKNRADGGRAAAPKQTQAKAGADVADTS